MSAVTKGLDPKALAIQLGYTGIIIAAVARLNALGVVPVAIFLAAITVVGEQPAVDRRAGRAGRAPAGV